MARSAKRKTNSAYTHPRGTVLTINQSTKAITLFVELSEPDGDSGEELDAILDRLTQSHFPDFGKGRGECNLSYFKPTMVEDDLQDAVQVQVWYESTKGTAPSPAQLEALKSLKAGDEVTLNVSEGDDARVWIDTRELEAAQTKTSSGSGRRGRRNKGGDDGDSGATGGAPSKPELKEAAELVGYVFEQLSTAIGDADVTDADLLTAATVVFGGVANRAAKR